MCSSGLMFLNEIVAQTDKFKMIAGLMVKSKKSSQSKISRARELAVGTESVRWESGRKVDV